MSTVKYFLFVLAIFFGNQASFSNGLSVTSHGSLQISMIRHDEIYATNRACYKLEDVQPKYHGMTHVRGLNDKVGTISFTVDVPVRVYLAVDSRYPYIHGSEFETTHDNLTFGGCHARTPFYIYKSTSTHGPGVVSINFEHSRMTVIFLRDARLLQPDAELKITPPSRAELSMVREGEKFSTNRDCYYMSDIPPNFYGLSHIRLLNDESSIEFTVTVPVVVYVAVDSRYPNILPNTFVATGQNIVHAGCHPRVNFPVYKQEFAPGTVAISLSETRMLAVFVEALVDNTFKSGVY